MQFTDLFIKRPVLATVVNLLILVLGIRAIFDLPIRQFPFTQNAVVTVTTVYTGADPALVAGFITTPLENSIAQANGIEYLSSSSIQGVSIIKATLRLNYEPDKALTEINTKVNAVLNQLPPEAQLPTMTVSIGETIDAMYIGFYSEILAQNKITDYLIRVVQPKLQAIAGVQTAEILGKRQFALRVWLDPLKVSAYNLTAADVSAALAANDFIAATGRTDGQMMTVNFTVNTGLSTVEQFKDLILKSDKDAIVRLGDVAEVTLGSEDYNTAVKFDGKTAVYIGIKIAPDANLLTVMANVRKAYPAIEKELPEGITGKIVYDSTKYVNAAIYEVEWSLVEALLIVTLVVFLFLGSIRSVSIPIVAIPLSLIGAFFLMFLLGYSINLLTLLALVLAIGLVVDDAIIVVENVYRHMQQGMSGQEAAILGARELSKPIIAISIVLIAVYIPIGFMSGLTGALFTEFAFTLAGAVGVSAIIALTLSPMMCAKFLKLSPHHQGSGHRLVHFIDNQFLRLQTGYQNSLRRSLNYLPVTAVFSIIILGSIYFLYTTAKTELAPEEDQGIIISLLTAAPNATLRQTELYSKMVFDIFSSFPEKDHIFQLDGINGLNTGIAGIVLKPWDERHRTAQEIQPEIQNLFAHIAGANVVAFQRPPLPGSSGLPVQFVIGTTQSFEHLNEVVQTMLDKLRASGQFIFIDTDLKFDKVQANIHIDRDKAGQLGLTMRNIGNILAANLSENYINFFSLAGRSYKVIPQVRHEERLNYDQILNYYVTTASGKSVPLATIATVKTSVVPESLNHFQQLNSATISGVPMPGVSLGDALGSMKKLANEMLPQGFSVDYAEQSRQYEKESSAFLMTFLFAMIIIFLTLAGLFESFRDPLIILISVPMSICGALIFISVGVGGASLNIYTQVGLVTLIGLISKHGILIVQFANDLQREGKSKIQAIQMAAGIRLRPILMTTASMVLGVVPLITATGAGAVSRFSIGLVIASGIAIGTLFTLYVVPAMYLMVAHELDGEQNVE